MEKQNLLEGSSPVPVILDGIVDVGSSEVLPDSPEGMVGRFSWLCYLFLTVNFKHSSLTLLVFMQPYAL